MGDGPPPEEDPEFFFTVHSAWCPFGRSGMLTVELKRPELSEPEWVDQEGKSTDKGLAGEGLKMAVSCNEDMEEGAGVTFRVYGKGADPKRDRPVFETGSQNKGGKAEAEWAYRYKHDPENPLKEKPKYFFTVNGRRCAEVRSGDVEIGQYIYIQMLTNNGMIIPEAKGKLMSGETVQDITISSGYFEEKESVPGNWRYYLVKVDNNGDKKKIFTGDEENYHVIRKPAAVLIEEGMPIPGGGKKLAIVLDSGGYSS
jgi:hypothetical protein